MIQLIIVIMKAFYNDNTLGVIEEVVNNNGYKLLLLSNGKYIPYHQEFMGEVDIINGKVNFKNLEGIV